MRIPARLLLGVGVILALTALLYLAWATDFTGLLWAMPKQAWLLAEERDRERDLAVQSDDVLRRIATHHRIAGDVIEGRLSLLEAAARFRDLDHTRPGLFPNWHREKWPGRSEAECYCRVVIGWVRAQSKCQPEEVPGRGGRLEAELDELLSASALWLP